MRESWAFARRSWRQQPVLSAVQAAIAVGLGLIAFVDLTTEHPPRGLSGLSALLYLASLLCFVVLVRRDAPDLDT